jgi:hypothetical protein
MDLHISPLYCISNVRVDIKGGPGPIWDIGVLNSIEWTSPIFGERSANITMDAYAHNILRCQRKRPRVVLVVVGCWPIVMEPSSEGPELFLWSLIVGRMVMEPSSEEIRSLGRTNDNRRSGTRNTSRGSPRQDVLMLKSRSREAWRSNCLFLSPGDEGRQRIWCCWPPESTKPCADGGILDITTAARVKKVSSSCQYARALRGRLVAPWRGWETDNSRHGWSLCCRILMVDRQHKNRDWMAGYQPTGVLHDPA